MKKVDWQMQEKFVFPISVGTPEKAENLKVTPRFTEERTADSVRLKGIYHISTNVHLNNTERSSELDESAILIDDVELDDHVAYFEYAVPLHIDLPAKAKSPFTVHARNISTKAAGQGYLDVHWTVECSFPKIVEAEEFVVETDEFKDDIVVVEPIPEDKKEVVSETVHENQKVAMEQNQENEKIVTNQQQVKEKLVMEDENNLEPVETALESTNDAFVENVEADKEKEKEKVLAVSTVATSNDANEALQFIANLDDALTSKTFRLNDVFVQRESDPNEDSE